MSDAIRAAAFLLQRYIATAIESITRLVVFAMSAIVRNLRKALCYQGLRKGG